MDGSTRTVLVTGGAGYIGSHAVARLLRDGHSVVVVDNLSRGHAGAVEAARRSARNGSSKLRFEHFDVQETDRLESLLRETRVDAVLHFAALAYVGESVDEPLRYYAHNACGSVSLLRAMSAAGVSRLIFSSTCATYGTPPDECIPIREDCPQDPINPYGHSKLFVERVIADHAIACRKKGIPFRTAALRYFNVAGCAAEAGIGEDHRPETHLIPICLEVALRQRQSVTVLGTDHDTPDGTCVRDYVHVEDLIDAHVRALRALDEGRFESGAPDRPLPAWNVGVGQGRSVREVIEACRRVTGTPVPSLDGPRRAGDPPSLYADASRIRRDLGWSPRFTELDETIASAWEWKQAHPKGY